MKTLKQDLGKVSVTCNGVWDAGRNYDRLCIVNDGNFASYISKKFAPQGILLSNEEYWQPIASLRDDIKIDYDKFKKEWIQMLAEIQLKLKSSRIVVENDIERESLSWLQVAAGCEVYVKDTKLSWILESIVPVLNYKEWRLESDSKIDSVPTYELSGEFENLIADRTIADRWGHIIDEYYVTRDMVTNFIIETVRKYIHEAAILPGSIKPEDLSQAVLDLIGYGQITNLADEEDLTDYTNANGTHVLRFKDKVYNEVDGSGLGRVYLRKNKVQGVNTLVQQMIDKPNTIYIVQYDYTLGEQTINLPENSILKFEGGTLCNGIIVGNNTQIDAEKEVIFKIGLNIEGTWNCPNIYDDWFEFNSVLEDKFISNDIINNILALGSDNVNNTIHFEADRTYYFELPYKGKVNLGDDVRPDYWKLNTEEYSFLRIFTGITSNTHIIFNNTLQMLPTNQGAYFIFHIENKENLQFSGTGTINGDAKDHLYTDPFAGETYYGEWGHVLNFRSCNNVVIRDITVGYAFGDGIALGNATYNNNGTKAAGLATRNVTVDGAKVLYARRNGISLGGNNYSITNVYFEGNGSDTIRGTAPMAAIDFENDYVDIEPSGLCTNVSMSNCKFKDNKYDVSSTIRDDLYEVPRGELVNISDCNFTSPLRLNRTNGLTFNNCHIVGITNVDNSIAAWYVSKDLIFSNCIFDELNPYLAISAEEQNKKFINPTYPEDIRYTTTFQQNMTAGRALKFTIPKPLVGEVEFTAFCSNPNYALIQLPINTTTYTFGPSSSLADLRDVKVKARKDSTFRYANYKNIPVFSYINYAEDANNFIIYFAIAGDLINDSLGGTTSVNIFLTSKTKFITIEAPVSGRPDYAGMYGGKWSKLSAIVKEGIAVSDIPETVIFPSKEIYDASLLADMPNSLTSDKAGKSIFILDSTYKRPAFWDSYSNVFRTADGNRLLERRVTSQSELDTLTAKLNSADRGYVVYITTFDSYLTWDGIQWINEDGSLFSEVKFMKITTSIDILNVLFSYSNVIYKIVGDIDLDGGELTIASGSTLDFQGGSFSNGTIIGNNTTVLPYGYKIQNVELKGTFKYENGVNAISSDDICFNNEYDILDGKNLAKKEVVNYELKDDDYTILPQFDTIKNVNAVDGSFIGFPTSVIYNNLLYCFYYKASTHESTPGIQENIYYKYSSDKGLTWSEEKEWALPASDVNGSFRSYRSAYVIPFGSNLLFAIFCTTSTSSALAGSFTLLCEASLDESHNITIVNQIKVPLIGSDGNLIYDYTDATITNSMIVGGNIIKVGSNYLIACYTSDKDNYIFSFDGTFTDNTHLTILDSVVSTEFDYTEHTFIKFSDTNFYIAFREDARRENTPIFKYNTSTSKFELFTYIDNAAYDGLDAILLNNDIAIIAGRDWRNYYTPTRFALINSSGKVFISNAKYYGDVLGRDCGYCSLQIIDNTLINIFYLKRSQPNYNYGVVSRRIPVDTISNLIYY